jgi:hypothetical protein
VITARSAVITARRFPADLAISPPKAFASARIGA